MTEMYQLKTLHDEKEELTTWIHTHIYIYYNKK